MLALATPLSQLWRKALICLLLLYEAGKQDAATERTFFNSLRAAPQGLEETLHGGM